MKYAGMTWGKMEAVVNKLGGMDGVRRLLAGKLVIERSRTAPAGPRAKIIPPTGGRIYEVRVRADYARPWREAALAAGPGTLDHYDVFKVGDQYPPEPKSRRSTRWQRIVLVNFGPRSVTPSEKALEWGKVNHLRPALPRECFAIGEHRPHLNRDLGLEYMAVVSLVTCSFGGELPAPVVWWGGASRGSDLRWFAIGWVGLFWFAFVRE